jgi:hypothetical protein
MAFVKRAHGGNQTDCTLIEEQITPVLAQRFYIAEDLRLWGGKCITKGWTRREEADGIVLCGRL